MPFVAEPPPRKSGFVPDAPATPDPALNSLVDPRMRPETMMGEREAVRVRQAASKDRENFIRQNMQAGVPIALEEELPAGLRARVSFEGDIRKQADLISRQPGVISARPSKDGNNVLVRMAGEDGKVRDVLLNPKTSTLSAGDIAGATAPLLKTGVLAGAAALTGGMSLPATAGVLGGTASGLELASSGGSRLLAGQDIDPMQLQGQALREAGINAALPLAGAAVKGTGKGISNLFTRGSGELERQLPAAASRLGMGTTLAEETGSPALARLGRLTPEEEAARNADLAAVKDRGIAKAAGTQRVAQSEDEIASSVQPVFAEAEQGAARGVRAAMTDAQRATQAAIQTELDSGIIPATRSTSEVGDFLREKIAGRGADSKASQLRAGAEKLYGEANALAEAEGIAVRPDAIGKLADKLTDADRKALLDFAPGLKKIPQLNNLLTKGTPGTEPSPTGVLDRFGRKVLSEGTPDTPPAPLPVPVARELRSVIYDMEKAGLAPGEGGVPGRYLRELYKAIDSDIDAAIKAGSPELQAAHAKADDFYRSSIQPLQQSDVAKLFLETDAAGRLGGDEVVRRLFRGQGNLDAVRAYRDVLGANSPEYKLLLRQGVQTIIDDSRAGKELIDAGSFLRKLGSLNDELQTEALGPTAKAVRANATLMQRAQGAKITEEELADALAASPGKASQLIEQAIAREKAYEQTYNSAIQQQLRNGTLGPRTIGSADDFLTRFVAGPNTSVEDIRQALTQIGAKSPDAVADIRQRTLRDIVDNSRSKGSLGRQTTGEVEDLSHEKLMEYTAGPMGARYQAVLGKDGMDFLKDLATYSEATAKRQAAEAGRSVAPETLAKEAASGAIGFKRNAIGALVDVAGATGRALGGGAAVRNPSVQKFIKTGELPVIGGRLNKLPGSRVLAVPSGIETGRGVLAEKDN